MGTFPAASDYARPAPIPAEGIPSVAAPQYTQTSAETTMAAGRDMQQTAQDIDKFSLHIDTLLAQDAVHKLRAAKADLTYGPENGFQNVKGLDVLNPGPGGQKIFESYPARLQAASDAIGGKLGGRAALMFKARADEEADSYKTEMLRHVMQQTDVANKQIYLDGTQQDVTEAVRVSTDPKAMEKLAERAALRAQTYEQTMGLPPGSQQRAAVSNVYRASIENLITKNDGPGALAAYATFGNKLDGPDALAVQREVKTLQQAQETQGEVNRLWGGTVGTGTARGPASGAVFEIPAAHKPSVDAAAKKYNLPPQLLASTFWNESRWDPKARNPGDQKGSVNPATGRPYDSVGIGQWGEQWAKAQGFDPLDPNASIEATAKAMRQYTDKYGGNVLLARLAYGWGAGNVDQWLANGGDPNKIPEGAKTWLPRTAYGITDDTEARAQFDRLAPALKPGVIFTYGDQPSGGLAPAKADGAPAQSGGAVSRETLGPGAIASPPASSDPLFGPNGTPAPVVNRSDALYGDPEPPKQEAGIVQPPVGGGVLGLQEAALALEKKHNAAVAAALAERANSTLLPGILSGINRQYEIEKQRLHAVQLEVTNTIQKYVLQGGPNGSPATVPPDATLWSQFTPEQQGHYLKLFEHNAKGADPPFTPDAKRVWMKLNDLATTAPEEFLRFDMMQLIPSMPAAELKQLQGLRDQIQKSGQKEYDSGKALAMADRSLALMGVDTRTSGASDKDVAIRQQLHSQLIDWMGRFQIENKRAPKDSEMRQQVDNMLIEGKTTRPNWYERNAPWILGGENTDQQGRGPPNAKGASGIRGTMPGGRFLFTVPQAELDKFYVPYKAIPADKRAQVEQKIAPQLKGLGDEAKQNLVEQTYLRAIMRQR